MSGTKASLQNHPWFRYRNFCVEPRFYGAMRYSDADALELALVVSERVRARTAPKAEPAWGVLA